MCLCVGVIVYEERRRKGGREGGIEVWRRKERRRDREGGPMLYLHNNH